MNFIPYKNTEIINTNYTFSLVQEEVSINTLLEYIDSEDSEDIIDGFFDDVPNIEIFSIVAYLNDFSKYFNVNGIFYNDIRISLHNYIIIFYYLINLEYIDVSFIHNLPEILNEYISRSKDHNSSVSGKIYYIIRFLNFNDTLYLIQLVEIGLVEFNSLKEFEDLIEIIIILKLNTTYDQTKDIIANSVTPFLLQLTEISNFYTFIELCEIGEIIELFTEWQVQNKEIDLITYLSISQRIDESNLKNKKKEMLMTLMNRR